MNHRSMQFGKRFNGRGVRRVPGKMNGWEKAYASHLDGLIQSGDVLWYKFEGAKLKLADNTSFTPDFLVLKGNLEMECHEVKGHWEVAARVKIKVAADLYPFRFIAVTREKITKAWQFEEI